jgi:hypothetical protein
MFLAAAPAVSALRSFAFFRDGMAAWGPRSAMRHGLTGVEGAIDGHASDLLNGRSLVEQIGEHGRTTHVAAGELDGLDLQYLPCRPQGGSCARRDVSDRRACVPLPFAFDLDPGAVDQKVQ